MKRAGLLLAVVLLALCLSRAYAAHLENISAHPKAPSVVQPYTVYEPPVQSSASQPTVSPLPAWQTATINMSVADSSPHSVDQPWELTIANQFYTDIIKAVNISHANISSEGVITGIVGEELEAEEGNRFYMGYVVNATENFFMPDAVMVNGKPCSVQLQNDLSAPPTLFFP